MPSWKALINCLKHKKCRPVKSSQVGSFCNLVDKLELGGIIAIVGGGAYDAPFYYLFLHISGLSRAPAPTFLDDHSSQIRV